MKEHKREPLKEKLGQSKERVLKNIARWNQIEEENEFGSKSQVNGLHQYFNQQQMSINYQIANKSLTNLMLTRHTGFQKAKHSLFHRS